MRHAPRRIVSLQPSISVILRDLGCLDALVGCTKYCVELSPEVRSQQVAILADSWTAQSDQISALHSDLVIASVPYQEKAIAEIMKSGARFLGFAPKSLEDIYGDVAMIAGILNVPERGEEVIQQMLDSIEGVRSQTRGLARPRVFCEEWGKPLIASQPWVEQLVEAAGGEFVGRPGKQTTPQEVKSAAPQVCIAAWCGAGDRVPLSKIVQQRGWEEIPAVGDQRVYCIRDEYLNTPAPTLVRGLRALAAAIHPERFAPVEGLRQIESQTID